MAQIKVLVVDDQQLVRSGLVRMLGDLNDFSVVGEAACGEDALDLLPRLATQLLFPHVVLMDLRMPGIGGLETTRRITQRYPQIRVVAITACDEQPFPQRFLDSGATGFITKDASIDEVVLAIKTVQAGKRYLSQAVAQDMALKKISRQQKIQHSDKSPFESLSQRELQAALMIVDGMKTSEIAEKLSVSPKTINTYRYRLFEKLNISSNMELALLANRYGLIDSNTRVP